MSSPSSTLQAHAGRLRTRMGACYPGSRAVFRGQDLHAELKDSDWVELYLHGITGRRFSPPQIKLLHAIWVCTSYPDARIWNNRVAALAGTARSTPALAIAAGLAVSEASIYGGQAGVRAIDFLIRIQRQIDAGANLDQLVWEEAGARRILGYGRPINSADERIAWLMNIAESCGLHDGRYVKLAFEVEKILVERKPQLRMNYAALTAALLADLGLSTLELHLFRVPLFLAGMPPCYLESREKPEGTLLPLSCAHILYEGRNARRWRATEDDNR